MPWDFNLRPELPNSQMELYYFESPHKQIFDDFRAEVVKVIDGDTIRVLWSGRDFDFPVRIIDINAPEMNEGGREAKEWLEGVIEGETVDIIIDKNQRVGKWGRLLGKVESMGLDMGEMMMRLGLATSFESRGEGKASDINKMLRLKQWV